MKQVSVMANYKDGRLEPLNKEELKVLMALNLKPGLKEVIVREPEKEKSRPLEKYYWSVLLPCCCQFHECFDVHGNNDLWVMHEDLLDEYAPRVSHNIDRKEKCFHKRTSASCGESLKMTGREQYEYVENIKAGEAMKGNYIPDPNEEIKPNEGNEDEN